ENFVKRYLLAGGKEMPFGEKEKAEGWRSHEKRASSQSVYAAAPAAARTENDSSDSLKALVQNVKLEAEKNAIAAALERTGWNRKAAARLLKVSYRTLLYKIEQYQMRAPDSSLVQGGLGLRPNGNGFRGNGHVQ